VVNIIAQLPVSNNIAELPGLGMDQYTITVYSGIMFDLYDFHLGEPVFNRKVVGTLLG